MVAVVIFLFQEQEKGDLLTSYRAMADENERLSSSVQQSLEESTSVKLQLAGITQVLVIQHIKEL